MKPQQSQTLYQKPVQAAAGAAQTLARNIAQQGNETLKTAKKQIGFQADVDTPPRSEYDIPPEPEVIGQVRTQGPENIDREALKRAEMARLSELEAQLKALRNRREQELAQYKENTQMAMQQNETSEPEAVAPQGKIRRALGQAKKAVTSIISNRKQSETKQGSGKG